MLFAQGVCAVGREALESSSAALQAAAKPSQLPARHFRHASCFVPLPSVNGISLEIADAEHKKKPDVFRDTGLIAVNRKSAECHNRKGYREPVITLGAQLPPANRSCIALSQ